ncbi:hypothetical protein QW180_09665 [Vibrio sinaloensis]|nr:hypothetical protein [Vibrio sinaloensis]
MDQSVGKKMGHDVGIKRILGKNIVNNLDLIHWIYDQLLAILVINR